MSIYGERNRIVLKINEDISLSIIQGEGCAGKENSGTVEYAVLYKGELIDEPVGYANYKNLIDVLVELQNEEY